ncbi:MAG: hypothetical protein WC865_16185 [Bacteroidales bacterium]
MIEELNKYAEKLMNEQNNLPIPEFEGYSPYEMHRLLEAAFGEKSPVQLAKLSSADYRQIPILKPIRYLAEIMNKHGELKLTAKGFLPTKVVAEVYDQGFMDDDISRSPRPKILKEADSVTVNLTRILMVLGGMVKKRNNKLSLTKSGRDLLSDDAELLNQMIRIYGYRFNWAYFDGYGENQIGQLGFGFSLILLYKYGNQKRLDSFYSDWSSTV